jgi:hypothetical protein
MTMAMLGARAVSNGRTTVHHQHSKQVRTTPTKQHYVTMNNSPVLRLSAETVRTNMVCCFDPFQANNTCDEQLEKVSFCQEHNAKM